MFGEKVLKTLVLALSIYRHVKSTCYKHFVFQEFDPVSVFSQTELAMGGSNVVVKGP